MANVKYVNEHFFGVEGKTPEQLKEMWYILGISFAQYSAQAPLPGRNVQHRNRWQSASEGLVGIVKSSLESEHSIVRIRNRNIRGGEDFVNYYLSIDNNRIYESIRGFGLGVPKSAREFPEIEEQYLDHFVRGFFDAQVSCMNIVQKHTTLSGIMKYPYQRLEIYFNVGFLKRLYDALVKHALVMPGKKIDKSPLVLYGPEVGKVYDFIYRDWDFIQESGLYLPSKKELFEVELRFENPPDASKVARAKRIERAKVLLRQGTPVKAVAGAVGYSHPSAFSDAFKDETGQTTTAFLKEQQQSPPV